MGDDDQLEAGLFLAAFDDFHQGLSQAFDVVSVKIRCWLVQRQDTAVLAEGFGQAEPDDDGAENSLAC